MTVMVGFIPARTGKLLARLLLQVAFLFAVLPASASLGSLCHHHGHGAHAIAEPVMGRHAEADHRPPPLASDHRGHCLTCCLSGCTAAWLTPSGSTGVAAVAFQVVRFTPEPTWWSLGQSAPPALPPPRRIA